MRKALIFGIDDYPTAPLEGCVQDARAVAEALRLHPADRSPNFDVKLHTCPPASVDRALLRREIEALFSGRPEMALLYFSGHGVIKSTGGYIVSQAFRRYDEGVSMDEILVLANQSGAAERMVVIDCCHSGAFGSPALGGDTVAQLSDGLTVLTSSTEGEDSRQAGGQSVFTSLLVEGLGGGAADLRGNVTPASLYAYVDQSLGAWSQRPVFKSNVSRFSPLVRSRAPVSVEVLHRLVDYFPAPDAAHALTPAYEFTSDAADPGKVAVFRDLQRMHGVGLVVPVGADHMYFAAMEGRECALTARGRYYWRLVKEQRI
ncbi:MAG: caspase domain-containing protein [Vicinamibacterales bacterium]